MNSPLKSRPPLLSVAEALNRLLRATEPVGQTEVIATIDALGRVLARDVVASMDVPAVDNSQMDGYAVRIADCEGDCALPVSQRIAAGHVGEPLAKGTVARIFTGAPVPEGADAVVMQEDVETLMVADLPHVRIGAAPRHGQWVRRAGEDIRCGLPILFSGTRIGPHHMALAASIGTAELLVKRRVKVAFFSTGDELVMPGAPPGRCTDL